MINNAFMSTMGDDMTEFMKRSTWSRMDSLAAFLVFLGLLLFPYAGRIDGYIAPVAHDFIITETDKTSDGTRAWGFVTIERPACNFLRLEWYLVGQDRQVLVPVNFEEGSKLRPQGLSEWGPWVVDMPEFAVTDQSRVVAYHQCPFRPWVTVSHLYP